MKTFGKIMAVGFVMIVAVVAGEMLKDKAIQQAQSILGGDNDK